MTNRLITRSAAFIRTKKRDARVRKAGNWTKVAAKICGVNYLPLSSPVVEVVYIYHFEGGFYGGYDDKPFVDEGAAREFSKKVKVGDRLTIRVKPGKPEVSVMDDRDQLDHEPPA